MFSVISVNNSYLTFIMFSQTVNIVLNCDQGSFQVDGTSYSEALIINFYSF